MDRDKSVSQIARQKRRRQLYYPIAAGSPSPRFDRRGPTLNPRPRSRSDSIARPPFSAGPTMKRSLFLLALLPVVARADADPPLLLQRPAVSEKLVAFAYAGDLWVVDRGGGDARRLT